MTVGPDDQPWLSAELSYWRPASGIEVDFIVNDLALVVEKKSSAKITSDHLKDIRALREDHGTVGRVVVVCREPKVRRTEDGIDILPAATFSDMLWSGELLR